MTGSSVCRVNSFVGVRCVLTPSALALVVFVLWPATAVAQSVSAASLAAKGRIDAAASAPTIACSRCDRAFDQIWVISTRGLGGCGNIQAPPNFFVQRRTVDGAWAMSSIGEFLAADDPMTPIGFAMHGNRVNSSQAIRQGMMAYRQFTAGVSATQPVRFVIWSWPSDRIHGILKDVRAKAARTTTDGKYLAWTLHQLDPQTPVSLIGFSYGARIASGALHVAAGGSLDGFSLGAGKKPRRPIRASFAAAAIHNYWLAEGQFHGRALEVVDSMLLINNSCDMALKRYRFLDRSRTAAALGYTGPAGWSPHYAKIRIVDACRDVGKMHSWDSYLTSARYTASQAAALRVGEQATALTSTESTRLYTTIAK
jgi:hypothetical protein